MCGPLQSIDRDAYLIFKHPADFPEQFVVRRYHLRKWGNYPDREYRALAPSLEEARSHVPPNFHRITSTVDGDTVIVETWI